MHIVFKYINNIGHWATRIIINSINWNYYLKIELYIIKTEFNNNS